MRSTLLLVLLVVSSPDTPAQIQASSHHPDSPANRQLVEKLRTLKVNLDFRDTPLDEAIAFLANVTGTNLVLDPKIFQNVPREQLRIHLVVRELPAWDALQLLLDLHGLQASFRRNILLISTRARILGKPKLVVYDIRDLLLVLQDFPGPRIRLRDSSQDNRLGASFGKTEERPAADTPTDIVDLIQTHTGVETWKHRSISIANLGGHLVVVQYPSVHTQIRTLLDRLRQLR